MNSIRVEVADEYVLDKIMTLINDKSLLRKVIDNINKNKSSKLQPTMEELDRITTEINKLSTKKGKNIELFEDGILDKTELSTRIKSINDDIDKLKFREQELKQEVQLAEGEPIPFEVIKDVMDKFKEVFFNMSTSQQRKQLIHLIVSQITINEKREVDSIEIQINDDVITYLMKDELPKLNGNSSFLHLLGMNHINFKIAI